MFSVVPLTLSPARHHLIRLLLLLLLMLCLSPFSSPDSESDRERVAEINWPVNRSSRQQPAASSRGSQAGPCSSVKDTKHTYIQKYQQQQGRKLCTLFSLAAAVVVVVVVVCSLGGKNREREGENKSKNQVTGRGLIYVPS